MPSSILIAVVTMTGAAGSMACGDSMPPATSSLVGRYAVVAIDAKRPPGFVSASVNNRVYGYDGAWMQTDTLWLRADSSAEEIGVFSYKMAGQAETVPTFGTEADTARGRYRVDQGL